MPANLVLVVDDDRDTRTILSLALRHAGYEVLTAQDGHEGVRQARDHQPDLILMDLQMPGLSGIDAARILKSEESTAHIPLVAVTASGIGGRIQEHGFCAILTKPALPTEIIRAVEICAEQISPDRAWIDLASLLNSDF